VSGGAAQRVGDALVVVEPEVQANADDAVVLEAERKDRGLFADPARVAPL
jgi:hypothetical protein